MADDCTRYKGPSSEIDLALDNVMAELPENQSGSGRHKCPYCAYERGILNERRRIAFWLSCNGSDLSIFYFGIIK